MDGARQALLLTTAVLVLGSSALAQKVPPLSESVVLEGAPGAEEAWPRPPNMQVFFQPDEIAMVTTSEGERRGIFAGETISVTVDELDPVTSKAGRLKAHITILTS